MGCLVMEGGRSQVDQETRTERRGTLFGEVQPPPPSVNGGAACLLSSCFLSQIVGGASRAPYHSFASRIPYGPT